LSEYLNALIEAAPVHQDRASFDLSGITEAMQVAGVSPEAVSLVSHAKFGKANIEALVDDDTLAFIHPTGILCTAGKRKLLSQTVKFKSLDFAQCREFGPVEYTDDRGFGKFGIEFVGPGNVLLGRIHWTWRAKRFRDSSAEIMAVAEERDRILQGVNILIGQ
jgi:hypothetical protein